MGALKVLHVYRTYFPDTQGGLEEVIRQICLNTRAEGVESAETVQPIERQETKVGRNDPCPCGSGKKYKKCCMGS